MKKKTQPLHCTLWQKESWSWARRQYEQLELHYSQATKNNKS